MKSDKSPRRGTVDGSTTIGAQRAGADAELAARARAVLDANWLGHATRPSALLYPHQWSWDSAFAAIGYARYDQDRAEAELRSLFTGQWRNGLLPHIVFVVGRQPYFPGPETWETERSPDAPIRPKTSGIVQPPVHATAAWHVYRHARDHDRATDFLESLLPRLAAWHSYLHRERTRNDTGLVEIWHPWESGMDNSPMWDEALARVTLDADYAPDYRRTDVEATEPSERPTDAEYDRYMQLVRLFRNHGYDPARIREVTPFAVHDVLFNSLLVQADRDLASIARVVGANPEPYQAAADTTARAINEHLWDDDESAYVDIDLVAGAPIRAPVAARFSPLFAGVPGPGRADRLVRRLIESTVAIDGVGRVVPSLDPGDPRFEPALYWRGPVWVNVNWLLYHGLLRYGYADEAGALRTALVELARRHGFSEHYSPTTGRGHGGDEFAWTAALVLDLLHDDQPG
ncbi:MAG: amylo-alpha-1,6-glucosidase [Acidimicrobiales bacterium]